MMMMWWVSNGMTDKMNSIELEDGMKIERKKFVILERIIFGLESHLLFILQFNSSLNNCFECYNVNIISWNTYPCRLLSIATSSSDFVVTAESWGFQISDGITRKSSLIISMTGMGRFWDVAHRNHSTTNIQKPIPGLFVVRLTGHNSHSNHNPLHYDNFFSGNFQSDYFLLF